MIRTRKELASILQEAWEKEVCVSINGISFLTNMSMVYITSTYDGIANNFIKVTDKEGTLISGITVKNVTSIFTTDYYEVSIDEVTP